jgi:DNA modification methylase
MTTKKSKSVRLTLDDKNCNRGNARGRAMVKTSLEKYGAGRSVLADKHGKLIAGNKTFQSASDIDLPIRVVETDGQELVVVLRRDLDLDRDVAARELAIADNRSSEVGLAWDENELRALVDAGADLDAFFDEKELAELIGEEEGELSDAEPLIDKAAELQREWGTETGQLWLIGKHRLLVGDATNKADVAALLAGNRPLLLVCDPPYGVNYDPAWRVRAAEAGHLAYAARRVGVVRNDERVDWSEAYALFPGDVAYIWHAGRHSSEVQRSLEAEGFEIRCQVIWAKSHFPISRGHYHWRHEPCWYAVRKGATAHWIGDHAQTTLWEINLDKNTDGGHSTQKPLECMARPIRNHEGDVYDPFVGSGTSLVAAENLNRICYAMEISPAYCAVVLERMTAAFPGIKIERLNGKQKRKGKAAA